MAEEKKEEPPKEAKKEGAEGAAADGAAKKGLPILYLALGGGAMVVVALAYFLTVAAVEKGAEAMAAIQNPSPAHAEELPEASPAEESKPEEHGSKEGEEKKAEEGHGEKPEGGHGEAAAEGEKKAEPGATVKDVELDEIRTNLAQTQQGRLIEIQFAAQFHGPNAEQLADVILKEPGVKSGIKNDLFHLIRTKNLEDLEGEHNFQLLLREVAALVNRRAFPNGEGRVANILVVKFMVQT